MPEKKFCSRSLFQFRCCWILFCSRFFSCSQACPPTHVIDVLLVLCILFVLACGAGAAAQRRLFRGRGDQQQDPQQEGPGGGHRQVQLHPRRGRGRGGTYLLTNELCCFVFLVEPRPFSLGVYLACVTYLHPAVSTFAPPSRLSISRCSISPPRNFLLFFVLMPQPRFFPRGQFFFFFAGTASIFEIKIGREGGRGRDICYIPTQFTVVLPLLSSPYLCTYV